MDADLEQLDRAGLLAVIAALQEQVRVLQARVAELEQRDPPPWAKANRPKPAAGRPARQRRAQNFARRVDPPTETVTHAVERCPGCAQPLQGGWVRQRRQVLELPETPVRMREHVVYSRRCPKCGQEATPTLDLSAEVVGHHRVGLRLMGVIAVLREQLRLPLRQIQQYLHSLHGLHLSCGELVAILKAVSERAEQGGHQIRDAIRASPVVHADETGWREGGQNGYVWSFSAGPLRYFVHGSRSGAVVDTVLGSACQAVLVTDFYAAYDHYPSLHQRCWVHLLRDVHALKQAHPDDAGVQTWATTIIQLYHAAKAEPAPAARLSPAAQAIARRTRRQAYDRALSEVCQPFVGQSVPQRVLCARILKYLPELFTFLIDPRVPADNNDAERAIRPVVVRRKISGGTRSAAGTLARTLLWTLTDTWQAQRKPLLPAWIALLQDPTAVVPV
jgi:transposase